MIAATNRPFDLDEAALRRLTKRIYIGLPDKAARKGLLEKLLKQVSYKLSDEDMNWLLTCTKGYSSADLTALCKDAAMEPVREIETEKLLKLRG